MSHLLIPLIAAALAFLATPRDRNGNGRRLHHRSRSGFLCDVCTVLTSVVTIVVWATCDLHFDGSDVLSAASHAAAAAAAATATAMDRQPVSGGGDECSAETETCPGDAAVGDEYEYPTGQGAREYDDHHHPTLDEVSDSITHHCHMASLILGTAMVLELLQVIAHRTVACHDRESDDDDDDGNNRKRSSDEKHRRRQRRRNENNNDRQEAEDCTVYTLFDFHDSECMLFVYALLFFIHVLMSNDRAGQTFGFIFAEPVAAMAGYYRPVSTVRYIEWSIASPTLMILVGRSIPRFRKEEGGDNNGRNSNSNPSEPATKTKPQSQTVGNIDGENISERLRPAMIVTVSYIFVAWLAALVIDPFWRWTLILVSLVDYVCAVNDQLTAWRTDMDVNATCAKVSDMILKVQIFVYGWYGAIFLLGLFDFLDPIAEQTAYTYADATIKLACSASLAAMRHADSLSEAKRERTKADNIASDLHQIIHDANAPIFALDADGKLSLWNEKLARLTGASMADVVGKPLENYLSRECRDEFREIFDARKRGETGMEQFHCNLIDRREQRRDSDNDKTRTNVGKKDDDKVGEKGAVRLVALLMTATALHDADGNFVGIVGVGSDLTEVTRIKAVEEKKDQFMAVVSHELKSPLHGIIGLAETLSQSEKCEDRKGQLKMVKSCAVRLLDLVSNIMQMSRLARDKTLLEEVDRSDRSDSSAHAFSGCGKEQIRKDPVDIASVVDEVCMLVTNATDKGNRPILNPSVKFENKLKGTGSNACLPIVEGNAYKITQVFYNILTNACKFCTHGTITIDACVNDARDRLEVSVTDTGIGINPVNLKRIFEPFEQESNSSIRSFGGIGLGLAISKKVIELHGGDVFVESVQGKGSKFVVSLPVTEENVAVVMVPSTELTTARPAITTSGSIESSMTRGLQCKELDQVPPSFGRNSDDEKIIILSVDDDIVNQEVIRSALSDTYELHIAMNGFEALEFFSTRSKLPDLVLLDVMMPGMDGFEVLKEIREQKKISPTTLPVIMLSAMEPVDKALIQSLKSGANDYVPKPFDPDILKARVSTAVEIKRLRQIENESFHHSRLLHDILPMHIVERLILGDRSISERHESVCMLFSDIVGWTSMSESVPTHQLIDVLNQLFSEFDQLTEQHGVFKADTIGDAYIVAAGHEGQAGPSDATLRVVEFAMSMLEKVKLAKPPNGMQLQMRVGIHTGPAYSGVVGTKVPKYTFFGDTVNTAARMEQTGVPGCINMSSVARQALASEVAACRSGRTIEDWLSPLGASIQRRDPIEVKGKGAMELFILSPKGISPSVTRRLTKMQNRSSIKQSLHTSQKSVSSLETDGDLIAREARLSDEIGSLRKDVDRREASEREAWAEVESLRLNLRRAESSMVTIHGERMRGDTSFAKRNFTPFSSPSPPLDLPAHEQIEELKLQLLVTTKSLMRARQAIVDKDADIDEMELQLQRIKGELQTRTRPSLQGSIDLTDEISLNTVTHRSSFMARTQELLESSAIAPFRMTRKRESGALSSLGSVGINEHDDDLDDDSNDGGITQLKSEVFQPSFS